MPIVTTAVVLLLVAGLITALLAVTRHGATVPRDDTTTQARAILDDRLASGEIDEAEYRERARCSATTTDAPATVHRRC